MLHPLDIFIIHSFQYRDDYTRLIELLDSCQNLSYINHSASPLDLGNTTEYLISDEELKIKLYQRINAAAIILLIAGDYINSSKWIHYELSIAKQLYKPIIAMKLPLDSSVPPLAVNYADQIIDTDLASLQPLLKMYCS